ncbi:MAG TPA: FGGY family carbohydrate kinase, partial [Actinomycetota bacterium]|nr:FGGY family carbohydrate kinase [Actinomycetota bacterium]
MTSASTGPYVIGCDVGSQGTNVALYSADGTLCASSYQPYDLAFPNPGWAEQDPELWVSATERGISSLLGEIPAGASAVKGLSFGSQLDGMVVCDGAGRALRPALIWMDRRAEAQAAALAERMAPEDFYRRVGANLDSSHAVFKAMWVRDEEPEVFAQAKHVMPPGSYVLWRTTGVLAVDYSNASSLALLDPRSRTWSDEVLEATGIDRAMLPELGAGTQAVGPISAAFAEATGLAPSTLVAMGCGDEMAATLGAGVFAAGEVCDVGSQGTNVAVYSADGTLCASSYQPYDLAFPNPGWAEQDPELWISATERGISSVLDEVEAGASAVQGLSFGSQLDGMVVCDGAGRALRPALIWMDRRAEAQAAALAERMAPEDFYRRVGANLDSSHAVFKAMWVRDEEPEVFAQAKHVMPPGSYVLWRTTGVLGVDYSNASSLALLDPRSRTWSD